MRVSIGFRIVSSGGRFLAFYDGIILFSSSLWRVNERHLHSFGGENPKRRDHVLDLGIDERQILKCFAVRWDVKVWIDSSTS